MLNVFLTRPVPDEGIRMLRHDKRIRLSIYPKDEIIPRKILLRSVKGRDVVWTILTDRVDKAFFDAAGPSLKLVVNYAVGFDNIDLKEAARRNILVANAPAEEVSESVAEHTIMLMFALARRVVEGDNYMTAGKYHGWGPQLLLGTDLLGKTLGIVGGGRIGSYVARRMHDGFGMRILYTDVARNKTMEKEYGALFRSKTQLLKEADIVSLHVPLLPSTRHFISSAEFRLMKKSAFLVNTARGPIVDEHALEYALKKQHIAGAGLDVFESEPHVNKTFLKLKNVILTPHTASASIEARQAMSRESAKNILAFAHGKPIPHLVK